MSGIKVSWSPGDLSRKGASTDMKNGLTIQEMAQEIRRQGDVKADYLVDTRCLRMETWGGQPLLRLLGDSDVDLVEPLDIRTTAHRQMSTYLGIPIKYYDKMLEHDPELLAVNVNRWLQRLPPAQRLLRTLDGHARAFLSNRYRRLDNLDIARVTVPVVGEMPGIQYESCQLTDDFMYLKAVNPQLRDEVRPGDVVQAGVAITNSETGLGAVSVYPLIFRLVCTNGMTAADNTGISMRRTHAGPRIIERRRFAVCGAEGLTDDDSDFICGLQNAVREAMNEARFAQLLTRMRDSAQLQLNTDALPAVVRQTAVSFSMTETEGEAVLQHLQTDGDYTLYGLANAVTRYSQDVVSYDRASRLEAIGYSVMTMSPELFRRINQVHSAAA